MRIIVSDSVNPYVNLATESYFLNHSEEDILFLWQSECAVVCGKHQNICAEIDFKYCLENNVVPARRLSGGGTVFHDLGNLNFTFIQNLKTGLDKAVNYKQFLEPIRAVLSQLEIQTTYSQRDDLLLNGFKISGNAQHIHQQKKRVLHHGTLLYDSALGKLNQALHTKGEYEGKAIKSVRSNVTNIRSYFELGESTEFKNSFLEELVKLFGPVSHLFPNEIDQINELAESKFSTWEWILGYSPRYKHKRKIEVNGIKINLSLSVDKGEIESIEMINLETEIPVYVQECHQITGEILDISNLRSVFSNWTNSELLQLF